jgi:hypothetical protein
VTRFLAETRERFLLAIAARIPPERYIELHFFQPIRQGGVESGVAVIAARPERPESAPILADAPPSEEDELGLAADAAPADEKEPRYTVYTAKYRLVLKGLDRGKWECVVVAEADAPLVTVETVVRGVQRRSGDDESPTRMSGDEVQTYLSASIRRD